MAEPVATTVCRIIVLIHVFVVGQMRSVLLVMLLTSVLGSKGRLHAEISHSHYRRGSSVNFREKTFLPENICMKN